MLISILPDKVRLHAFSRFLRELSPGSKAHAIPLGVAVSIPINRNHSKYNMITNEHILVKIFFLNNSRIKGWLDFRSYHVCHYKKVVIGDISNKNLLKQSFCTYETLTASVSITLHTIFSRKLVGYL